MKFKFSFLVALAAALVAGCAAYYSVFGLSQLFAGASIAVIVMASSLEFSKIIAVSFLQRNWKKISMGLKTYLMIGIFVLVTITSAGIYGFLSNAYQKTAHKLEVSEGVLKVLNTKKESFEKSVANNQTIINSKNVRLSQLNNLRNNQEVRLDGATNTQNKRSARADIDAASKEIQALNSEIDTLSAKNAIAMDSINVYVTKAIESQSNNNVVSEIGPLKYLAQLTGKPMDKIVNWFILLLIFVFDPLAVALVIATNRMLEIEKKNDEEEHTNPLLELLPKKTKREEIPTKSKIIDEPEIIDTLEPIEEPEVDEILPELEPEPEEILPEPEIIFKPKKEPVITTGKIEVQDIKEIKEETNRGFSVNIPRASSNTIERIGTNKIFKDNNKNHVIFKRNGQ